jgi:hypothetical protein
VGNVIGVYENKEENHVICIYDNNTFKYEINEHMSHIITRGKWIHQRNSLLLKSDSLYRSGYISVSESYNHNINGVSLEFKDLQGRPWCCARVIINDSLVYDPSEDGVLHLNYTRLASIKLNGMTIDPFSYHPINVESNIYIFQVKDWDPNLFFMNDTLHYYNHKIYLYNYRILERIMASPEKDTRCMK